MFLEKFYLFDITFRHAWIRRKVSNFQMGCKFDATIIKSRQIMQQDDSIIAQKCIPQRVWFWQFRLQSFQIKNSNFLILASFFFQIRNGIMAIRHQAYLLMAMIESTSVKNTRAKLRKLISFRRLSLICKKDIDE